MKISKELQELQTRAEDLFYEAKSVQRSFVIKAEAEGLSEREMRERWPHIVDWGSKERNAEMWKANLAAALDDEDVHEVVESMDKLEEELMTYVEPEDMLEETENRLVEYNRQLNDLIIAYGSHLARKGMSVPDIARAVAKVLGRKMPDDEDPFADDTLE